MNDRFLCDVFENVNLKRLFLIDLQNNREITYGEFYSDVWGCSEFLKKSAAPEIIVTLLQNSYEFCVLFFAAMFSGKIISPIDPQKSQCEIDSILQTLPDGLLVVDGKTRSEQRLKTISIKELWEKKEPYSREPDAASSLIRSVHAVNPSKPYLITYTSGTSGRSKGVIHSVGNLFRCAEAFRQKMNIQETDVFLHVLPMSYMAGILNLLILPFVGHSCVALGRRFDVGTAAEFWRIVAEGNANKVWLAPAMLAMIMKLDRGDFGKDYCEGRNVTFYVGTAPLGARLKAEFEQRYRATLFQSYGLSETLFISVVTKEDHEKNEPYAGTLLDGVTLTFSEDGEILIDVPWMFLGYTNEDTGSYFVNGKYRSGDIGTLHSDGLLQIRDRKKDLIIRGGINLSPNAIEQVILQMSEVDEAAVFAVEDEMLGELVCCCMALRHPCDFNALMYRIRQAVRETLGRAYQVDRFVVKEKLLRNANGKIDKQAMRRALQGSDSTGGWGE